MNRVRGSAASRERQERDARECLCRKELQPWRAPPFWLRLEGAGLWLRPHRLEPFRGEFVARTERRDPRTFRIHFQAHRLRESRFCGDSGNLQIILSVQPKKNKRKFPRPGLTHQIRLAAIQETLQKKTHLIGVENTETADVVGTRRRKPRMRRIYGTQQKI